MACLTIDCQTCAQRDSDACSDCVVTFLCGREAQVPLVLEEDEYATFQVLGGGGLIPPIRHSTTRSERPLALVTQA